MPLMNKDRESAAGRKDEASARRNEVANEWVYEGRMQLQWSGYKAAAALAAAEISSRNQDPKVEKKEQCCPHAG